jgi:hypothetical protein
MERISASMISTLCVIPKLSRQYTIDFDRNQAPGALRQQGSDDPASWPDFKDCTLRHVAESVSDSHGGAVADEEMLSQFRFLFGTSSGGDLRHVDPLFLGHLDWLVSPRALALNHG